MYKKTLLALSAFLAVSGHYVVQAASHPASDNTTNSNKNNTQKVIKVEPVEFISPWARPSISPNNNSAVYLVIKNNSQMDYNLIGASALDVANNVEIHKTFVDEKGVSKMTSIDKLLVPAYSELELRPGGIHVMLFNLKQPLNVGDKFKMQLKFENIGLKVVEVEVKEN